MTSKIQKAICLEEVLKSNLPCENVKYLLSDWECDVLSLNKSGYLIEFEVKISRPDFLVDAKKRKFNFYNNGTHRLMPNRFYYVCPEDLISVDEIPSIAGLMYYNEHGLSVVKNAPLLHKLKHDPETIKTKFLRLYSERKYLGCARLTHTNNELKKAWEEHNI